jgi:hypothetical protein
LGIDPADGIEDAAGAVPGRGLGRLGEQRGGLGVFARPFGPEECLGQANL